MDRSPAADVDGLLVPIDRRRFGAAPAMMVPRRSGATRTTLAATQRHPCRCGMVTADCAWSRSRPESVVASGALKDQRKIPASTIFLIHLRARGDCAWSRSRPERWWRRVSCWSLGGAAARHPCRSGMVTADCAWSRSRPETVVASGGTEGSAENSRVDHLSHPLARARR